MRMGVLYKKESVSDFIRGLVLTIDGWAVILCSILSFVMFVSGLISVLGLHMESSPKQLVILAFTPLIVFLSLIRLRQLPFAERIGAGIFRAVLIVIIFFVLNF